MGKKELLNIIDELQKKVKVLSDNTDGQVQEAWVTAYQYAQQAKVNADKMIAHYGTGKENDLTINDPKIKRLWRYTLPFENWFAQTYWFEANRFADWWCAYIPFRATRPEDYEEFELFKRNFFLWGEACMVKEDDRWLCGRIIEKKDKKVKVSFDQINHQSVDVARGTLEWKDKASKDNKWYEIGSTCIYARAFWDSIGFYVKAIPYLGTHIYFWRQLEKNMSWANVVPVASITNPLQKGQLMSFLSDCDTWEVDIARIKLEEGQKVSQNEILFDKIKWLIPEGVKEYLDSQILNLEKHYEVLCNNFGRPITNASGEQRLSADANTFASNSEYIAKNIMERFAVAAYMLSEAGMELDQLPNPLEQEEEQDNLENDNAEKKEDQKTGEFQEHKQEEI